MVEGRFGGVAVVEWLWNGGDIGGGQMVARWWWQNMYGGLFVRWRCGVTLFTHTVDDEVTMTNCSYVLRWGRGVGCSMICNTNSGGHITRCMHVWFCGCWMVGRMGKRGG